MTETEDYDKSADPTDHASNHESGGSDPIDNLGPLTGLTISGDGVITWEGASAGDKTLFDVSISGDTHPRVTLRADGRIDFGSGSSSPDIYFYRESTFSMVLRAIVWANWGSFRTRDQLSTSVSFQCDASGDTQRRFILRCSGSMEWGPGNAAVDCHLSRRTANILNTPDRFEVGTLGVANSANATTPGNCQKKVELFDSAGNSLGFIAVYDAIT